MVLLLLWKRIRFNGKHFLNKLLKTIYLKLTHFKFTYTYFFAHHPLCGKYRDHTYKIGGIYVCKGCFHTYSGLIVFFVLNLVLYTANIEPIRLMYNTGFSIIPFLLFLLPLVVDFMHIKVKRPIKNIFRQMLGYFISTGLLIILFSPFLLKLIAPVIILIVYIFLRKARKSKKHDLCKSCPEMSSNSVCSGYGYMFEKEKEFSIKAGEYMMRKYKPYS